jgi:hypothetical protein
MVVEVVQQDQSADGTTRRGGASLIVDLGTKEIRYVIYKRLYAPRKPGEPVRELASEAAQRLWLDDSETGLTRHDALAAASARQAPEELDDASFPFDRSFRIPLAAAEAAAINQPQQFPAFSAHFDSPNDWRGKAALGAAADKAASTG